MLNTKKTQLLITFFLVLLLGGLPHLREALVPVASLFLAAASRRLPAWLATAAAALEADCDGLRSSVFLSLAW